MVGGGKGGETRGQRFQGVERESFAYKMLLKNGWEEGKGLGSKEQGIKSHIRARKKSDLYGVGQVEADEAKVDWTVNMTAYDKILSNLRSHHSDAAGPSGRDAPARKAKDAKRASKSARKVVTHQGRYKKREKGKLVASYSTDDLAAILGLSGPAPKAAPTPAPQADAGPSAVAGEAAPKRRVVVVVESKVDPARAAFKPAALAADWWGRQMFARSSNVLDDEGEDKAGKRMGSRDRTFTEDDQEAIFNRAHDTLTQNKKGLGSRDVLKIQGGAWAGKKIAFDGDSDDSSSDAVDVPSASDRAAEQQGTSAPAAAFTKSLAKALILQVLTAKGKKIKARRLQKSVFKAAGLKSATEEHQEVFRAALGRKTKQFCFDGTYARMPK